MNSAVAAARRGEPGGSPRVPKSEAFQGQYAHVKQMPINGDIQLIGESAARRTIRVLHALAGNAHIPRSEDFDRAKPAPFRAPADLWIGAVLERAGISRLSPDLSRRSLMMPETSSAFLSELRRGWRPGLGATFGMATGLSLYLITSGFFVKPLGVAFHWTRGQIGLGASASLIGIVATPVAGWLSDRFGVRVVGSFGLVALAGALIGLSAMPNNILVFYGWVAFINLLGAAASPVVLSRPLAQFFQSFRGAALGCGLAFTSLIVMVLSPSLQAIIAAHGWRVGYLFLAATSGLLGLGAVIVFVPSAPRIAVDTSQMEGQGALRVAMRDRRFWLMFVAMLLANLCFGGLLGQLPALLADRGLAPLQVGFAMSLMGGAGVMGRIVSGIAMDRLKPSLVSGVVLLVPIGGLLFLMKSHSVLADAVLAVFLIGSAQGGEATILSFLTARFFGLRGYGSIYGALAIAISISIAVGGAMFGLVFDKTGSYEAALMVAAIALVLAALCLFCTGFTPRQLDRRQATASTPVSPVPVPSSSAQP
jgi:MFS family permease